MRRKGQYFASVFLSAALMAPLGAMAMPAPQDDHERHEQEEHERRVYDAEHRDYHNWDAREDGMYRHWLEEKHRAYVDYDRLDAKMQHEYWEWRHKHEEHEEHEHQ
jgi:hypothetical protein